MTCFIRRLFSMLATIWLATTLAFFGLRILPGDAIEAQLAQSGASPAVIEARRAQQGLSDPVWLQYGRLIGNALQGNLGYSLINGQPVSQMIAQQFTPTAVLALSALLTATVWGVILGIVAEIDSRWGTSFAAHTLINLALSTPIYWTGTLAILIFSAQLELLPSAGSGRFSHLILPAGVLGFHTSGSIARIVAVNIREARLSDFVRTARAKGLSERIILRRHVLRVGLPPVVTIIALQAGFLLGGTVVTESLFVRPGIGRLMLDSTLQQDYPVVQGIVILGAVIYAGLNVMLDILYRYLDPRVTAP